MANSAGGIIIYGVREFDAPDKKHLPEKIDPVDLTQFSKEWLEQVIMNIRPRVSGISIFPVSIDSPPNRVIYVVDIPQSTTAHQSNDHRYYRRFNFMAVPMEDYEIRDIMSRNQHPKIELRFEIEITSYTRNINDHFIPGGIPYTRKDQFGLPLPPEYKTYTKYTLKTYAFNIGNVYAQYINARIGAPYDFLAQRTYITRRKQQTRTVNLQERFVYSEDNTVRDVITGNSNGFPEMAAARYVPILPSTNQKWADKELNSNFEKIDWDNNQIKWVVYADNALPNRGEIAIADIPILDLRNANNDDD